MRNLVILFSLIISFSALGEELNRCFYDHVKDAIELNKIRKPLYAKATNGESLKISRYLILWERFIILKSLKYDRKAAKFKRKGIPVMCEDFVDMALTPEFIIDTTQIPRPYLISKSPKAKEIKSRLKASLQEGFNSFKKQTENEIQRLEFNSSYDCLLRHLLESLRRTGDLAPRYLKRTQGKQKKKLNKLLTKYLKLQIFGISQAIFIDKKARSLQSTGVPILCNDVPHVELSPWQ
ncbi:MAG: hypothetical protein ACJAT2_000375 [Bacteriovoracaceae bacterium]|jgi:hypothetical protein